MTYCQRINLKDSHVNVQKYFVLYSQLKSRSSILRAITILYEANKISGKFLAKAVEHIESVKKEVQENDEYEAIRDMAEEKLKPYLLAVAVKMAKFVDLPVFRCDK